MKIHLTRVGLLAQSEFGIELMCDTAKRLSMLGESEVVEVQRCCTNVLGVGREEMTDFWALYARLYASYNGKQFDAYYSSAFWSLSSSRPSREKANEDSTVVDSNGVLFYQWRLCSKLYLDWVYTNPVYLRFCKAFLIIVFFFQNTFFERFTLYCYKIRAWTHSILRNTRLAYHCVLRCCFLAFAFAETAKRICMGVRLFFFFCSNSRPAAHTIVPRWKCDVNSNNKKNRLTHHLLEKSTITINFVKILVPHVETCMHSWTRFWCFIKKTPFWYQRYHFILR